MSSLARLLLPLMVLALAGSARADDRATEFATEPLAEPVVPRDLSELLATVDAKYPLRVTLSTRETVEGHPWRVYGDTLLLVAPTEYTAGIAAPDAAHLLTAPVTDIIRVQQRRSGLASGAGWGAKSGALVGGGLGLLIGVLVATISEDDDSVAGPIVVISLAGVGTGALLGSGIGAGVGAMTHDWYTIWPLGEDPDGEHPDGAIARTRMCVEAGWSHDTEALVDGSGPGARLGILRRLGDRVEMGPFVEYHNIRGLILEDYDWYYGYEQYEVSTSSQLSLGLDVRVNSAAVGSRPFFDSGVGWCAAGDLFLGAHLGAGLRWRNEGNTEYSLALRRYFALTGTDGDRGRFWAVSAGITFGP
jgi:hypothetical protein